MRRALVILLIAVCFPCLSGGCAAPAGDGAASPRPIPSGIALDEQRQRDLRNIMQAKLVYTNALLEAIALEDFPRIEYNAMELAWLSRQSDWQVHDTISYVAFSDRFQEVTDALAASAREGDIEGAASSYRQMTATCVDCHAYLRREGLVKDLPGVVTYAPPPVIQPERP